MNAREALFGCETGEIAAMFLHPVAEAKPQRARLFVRQRDSVDPDRERSTALVQDFTSPSTSVACLLTSTER